jgi:hypothetical protein
MDVLLGAAAVAAYGAIAGYLVLNGAPNVDEGFYGLTARAAVSGLVPYHDFGYTQMPLFPYVHGAVSRLVGFGPVEQRMASGLWALLAVAVGTVFLWRRFGRAVGIGFAALLVTTLNWVYFTHLPKTYAFVGAVILVNIVILEARADFRGRMFWTSLLGVVAVGSRLPVAPFYAVVWLGLLSRDFSAANLLRALGWPAVFTLGLLAPFAAAAPRPFLFWALDFPWQSAALKYWRLDLPALFYFAPAVCLAALALGIAILSGRVRLARTRDVVLLGLLVALACNVLPVGAYEEYATPLLPGLALVLCATLGDLGIGARVVGAFYLVLCLVNLCGIPPIDPTYYADTRKASLYVRQFQRGAFPFVGSASVVALEAGRPVDPRMLMGSFCCTEDYPESQANLLRLMTPAGIAAHMEDPRCEVFVLYNRANWNFVWSMPRFQPISASAVSRWKAILSRDFRLEYGDAHYAVYVRRGVYEGK